MRDLPTRERDTVLIWVQRRFKGSSRLRGLVGVEVEGAEETAGRLEVGVRWWGGRGAGAGC